MSTFYITTTLPYVNADPHIGFGLELIAADVIARYQRLLGKEVIFNTGTDEHGQKIWQKAQENSIDPQEYCDQYAAKFQELSDLLAISNTHFIRTTDPAHKQAAQEFWRRCAANGDIYKRMYKTIYCVGCELEKQASELVDGRCPLHANQEPEVREEENYFFRFSKYQEALLNLYESNPTFVQPASKYAEITAFVTGGLNDFSISRLKHKMPWGVAVPNDEEHVMYVWFDALVNYISTLGWPNTDSQFATHWPGIQVAGKDNLRQQSAMWQAMLLSAGLHNSHKILINGFISVDGQKMSKSLGNVISPQQLVDRYGQDATRYLLLNLGPFGQDMDVSWEKFDTTYTADLSNGLGNLCSRIAKLCEKTQYTHAQDQTQTELQTHQQTHNAQGEQKTNPTAFHAAMSSYEVGEALGLLITGTNEAQPSVAQLDKYLAETKPWKLPTNEAHEVLGKVVGNILVIATQLQPYMPTTAKAIIAHFSAPQISALQPLFPRLDRA